MNEERYIANAAMDAFTELHYINADQFERFDILFKHLQRAFVAGYEYPRCYDDLMLKKKSIDKIKEVLSTKEACDLLNCTLEDYFLITRGESLTTTSCLRCGVKFEKASCICKYCGFTLNGSDRN